MDLATRKRRLALFAFFFVPGISMASWVTRTPSIRDSLGVSIAEMGSILFGLSMGSMIGILAAGAFVDRFGTKTVMAAGLWFIVAAMIGVAAGEGLSSALLVALGLASFGFGMGISEIAINMDGADLERLTGTHLLHSLHGFFSLGTVCGALIGTGLNLVSFPVAWHMIAIAVFCGALIIYFIGSIPSVLTSFPSNHSHDRNPDVPSSLWKEPTVLAIGFIVLAMALAEGSANDWLPLLMVDDYGFSATSGSVVYLGFATAMTVGRFGGGIVLRRFGRSATLGASAIVASIGITTIILGTGVLSASVAVILWGLGASLGFPVALSAAADTGPNGAQRVKLVAVAGYVAFLVGPPLLGLVGEVSGLRNAMYIVLALVAAASFVAPAIRPRSGSPLKDISQGHSPRKTAAKL
ncbi:MFS transporter [Pararhizobium qamdonense]|uniref:MFS transporter n=1 Tax=Pararhizobium qamdonense TaxID=3031126 RepID=UPI0023E2A960|nr:MFS transporter [Pararhizobium qamdonense]